MRKLIVFVLASGLASVSGLLGCQSKNPDKPAESESPKIVVQKDRYDPKLTMDQGRGAVEVRLIRDVDLQDRFDFSAAVSVKTHAQCGALSAEKTFTTKDATLVDLLPEEVVIRDLKKDPEPCALYFELRNAIGSVWVLSHHAVVVHDDRPPTLRIGRDDGVEIALNVAGSTSMEAVRVRGPFVGEAALVCEDGTFNGPRFDQVVDYAHFDFARPVIRPDRDPRVMAQRRYELCRAFVRTEGRTLAFSAPYRVQFPRAPVVIRDVPLDMVEGFRQYKRGENVALREFDVVNTEKFPRRMVFDGRAFLVRGDIMRKIGYDHDRSIVDVKYVLLEIPGLSPWDARREVTLPPGGSLRLRLAFQRMNTLKCRSRKPLTSVVPDADEYVEAVLFTMREPVNAYELEADGSVIQQVDLAQDTSRLIGPFPIDFNWYGSYTNNCSWY